jgi:hypothetical protein
MRARRNVFAFNSSHPVDLPSGLCQRRLFLPMVFGMPIEAICPSCKQKLKVPDALVGKKVRCQKCNSIFMAEEEIEMEVVEEPPQSIEVIEGPPKAKREERPPRVLDDEEEEDELDDEPRPPRRRKRRKRRRLSSVAEQVRIPALLLYITGFVGAGVNLIWVIYRVVVVITLSSSVPAGSPGFQSGQATGFIAGAIIGVIVQLCVAFVWSALVVKGAQSMSSLQGYSSAIAGCIIAMLPCGCGCFMGLPIGIWGLVVLTQNDVKRAFD